LGHPDSSKGVGAGRGVIGNNAAKGKPLGGSGCLSKASSCS
jgi:hypothetical protein